MTQLWAHRWQRARVVALLGMYVTLALLTALPAPWRWHTNAVGSNRDALFNLAILDSVARSMLHWQTLWRGQFFQPHSLTVAYSDAVLPQSLLFGLLRPVFGPTAAFDIIELFAWTVALWSFHCLLRRFSDSDMAAVVGSIGWNFSTVRLTQFEHFQLITAAALIPVVLLALFRLVERPSVGRGVVLGLSLATITAAATYYGLMMFVATGVAGIVVIAVRGRPAVGALSKAVAAAGAVAALLIVPVWLPYQKLEENPHFRRSPDAGLSTQSSDLAGVAYGSKWLGDPPLHRDVNPERPLFPGVPISLLGLGGGVIVIAGLRARRGAEPAALLVVGVVMLILSGGGHAWTLGQSWLRLYHLVGRVVPGFSGIRAPARFAVLFQLGLATLAVVALERVRQYRVRMYALVIAVSLVGLLVETRVDVPVVRAPDRHDWVAVNDLLRRQPTGLTVELPVVSESSGWLWGYTEAPRMFLARRDRHPRVNGYSGFEPTDFERIASSLNTFPSSASVTWLRRLRVRYVAIRGSVVGYYPPDQRRLVKAAQPKLDRSAIRELVARPAPWVERVWTVDGAVLVEIRL